ncbi:hypothetical protein JK386_17870 [Nocardioides sp. zg-536]|uniref:DUF4190 domain-containing protein n=1 Tax=Nocardioides faecalis TaxID=2803858 RepID=A0A938Y7Z1_9ACTN|nr:hypothetical protein [Nocardioides faecalis]MBM9461763.1 hypothetical protein [Nocardioides faecalis]QVI58962.1 hypothetical protein KG111_00740 [Nocardioides faecalis]
MSQQPEPPWQRPEDAGQRKNGYDHGGPGPRPDEPVYMPAVYARYSPPGQQPWPAQQPWSRQQPPPSSGLYVAAAILNWITLASLTAATCGFGIIAAAWYVPMTICIHKAARDRRKHTALGVCTLVFCNLIAGILMLVEDSNRDQRLELR